MTVMPCSQGVGLLTAIAVSGCSVMLLLLGRQKLLELKKDSSCLQAKVSQEGGDLISHSCEHHPQQLTEGGASPDKKRNLVKKVRFSEDVVEPSGGNVAYRRRHAMAVKSEQQPTSQKPSNIFCQDKGIEKQRRVESERTVIPAKRMALYIGICNDRSRRALDLH